MSYTLLSAGYSDIGNLRHNNEDCWAEDPEQKLYLLADGMGGHQAGEVASEQAVRSFSAAFKKVKESKKPSTQQDLKQLFLSCFLEVNKKIYQMSHSDPHLKGMGTTLCGIHFFEQNIIYGHVGDSRIYRFRQNKLSQLSVDHSLLRELIDLGQLDEHKISEFLYKNILTKAIGADSIVEPSIHTDKALPGDIYLMCTDGLSDLVTQDMMEEELNRSQPISQTARQLVQMAKDRGGYDNITLVFVQVKE